MAKETQRANRRCRSLDSLRSEPAAEAGEDCRADDRIARAVSLLPDVYRQVILLRYYAGRSCAEISRDLDTPLGTVTKRLSRAYAILRASLAEQELPENSEAQS